MVGVNRRWETPMVLNIQAKMKPKCSNTSSEGERGDKRHGSRRVRVTMTPKSEGNPGR